MTGSTTFDGEWIRRFHPSEESTFRLVCFPHAGGSASYYYALSKALAPGLDMLALQYPGRQDRAAEGCITRLSDLADHVYAALRDAEDGRPYVFFGHSMGSVLAFEVARRYQDRTGTPPSWLLASGYPAPSRLRGGTVHRRDAAGILDELRTVGGTDPAWLEDAELLAAILPPVRADYTAVETHPRSDARLTCPITTLTGDNDPHTTVTEAEAWADHTTDDFTCRVFSGGHFFIDQHVQEITSVISDAVRDLSAAVPELL
ncbi:thioesterase II family protein [Streptomyces sp. NPDC016845]|uniref:thioesterase II family protein n=1 Tax=Streptomyces sp. NPDC016845 TaxID=3364972 RepID=UPI0037B7F99E